MIGGARRSLRVWSARHPGAAGHDRLPRVAWPYAGRVAREKLLRIRSDAEQEVDALASDLAALFAASEGSNADDEHDPEGATIGFERAQLTALLNAARHRIAEVDDALRRLDEGSYGTCEQCGAPIPAARLAARPFARRCVACA
jgi:DnaK suppressor protein